MLASSAPRLTEGTEKSTPSWILPLTGSKFKVAWNERGPNWTNSEQTSSVFYTVSNVTLIQYTTCFKSIEQKSIYFQVLKLKYYIAKL